MISARSNPLRPDDAARLGALRAYRNAWWLKSLYGSDLLVADFGGIGRWEIPLTITLANGRDLTENRVLVGEIYDYLYVQSLPPEGYRPRDGRTEKEHFIRALNVLDYFLLSDTDGKVAEYGLSAITSQRLTQFLLSVATKRLTVEGIYDFPGRLQTYLREQASALDDETVKKTLARKSPKLNEIPVGESAWRICERREELLRIRAFLHHEGLYKATDSRRAMYKLMPSSAALARRLFANSLYGRHLRLSIERTYPELCISPNTRYQREMGAVRVWAGSEDPRPSEGRYNDFRSKLEDFRKLSDLGVGIRREVLDRVGDIDITSLHGVSMKAIDGVRPAPPAAVAKAVRAAVELFCGHADHLLTSAARVLSVAREHQVSPSDLKPDCFQALLLPETREFGIRCWSLHEHLCVQLRGEWPTAAQYLAQLKAHRVGLWDLCTCLYGGSLLVVGTTQAGRSAELLDICAADIARPHWLRLLTRKAGSAAARYQDYRPIPHVSEQILIRLSEFLADVGEPQAKLFSPPALRGGLGPASSSWSATAIDRFLDYIEGDCDFAGRRHYLRQHQLRQFFAEAFFYSFGFAGLDTLRWFLRHLDPQQVWEYIEHTTPGRVLRRHKATAAALLIREGSSDLEALVLLVKARYGVSNIEVLSDEELAELIVDLQAKEEVKIEPVFVKGRKSTFGNMRLGVVVRGF